MSREAKWTTTAIDFDKLRGATNQREADLIVNEDIHSAEIAQHPSLQPFYKKITAPGFEYSSLEEKLADLKGLVSSLVLLDPSIKPEEVSIPLSDELSKKIQEQANYTPETGIQHLRYKQYSKIVASTAIALSNEAKSLGDIKRSVDIGIEALENELSGHLGGLSKDLNRTEFTFTKDGTAHKLMLSGEAPKSIEEYRNIITTFSAEKGLGLSGEQIDYIMHSRDQGAFAGAGTNFLNMKGTYSEYTIIPEELIASTVHIIDITDEQVTVSAMIDKNFGENLEHPDQKVVTILKSDISKLKGDRLRVGISEGRVTTSMSITSSEPKIFVPDTEIEGVAPEAQSSIKEICRIRILSSEVSTLESQTDLLGNQTRDILLPEMISSMAKIKGTNIETLTLNVALEKGITGKELKDLASRVASAFFTEDNDELKTQFIREVESRDLQKNLNSITGRRTEQSGAFTEALIDTSISQRRVGEIIASHPDTNFSRLSEYRRAKYLSTESQGALLAGFATKLTLSKQEIGTTLATFVTFVTEATEPVEPLNLVICFSKSMRSSNSDAGEIISSLSKELKMSPEQSKKLIAEFATSKELAAEPLGNLLAGFAKSQSLTPEQSKELIAEFAISLTPEDSKTLITNFIKSQALPSEDSGKLLANLIKGQRFTQADKLDILSNLCKTEQDQGKLLKAFCDASSQKDTKNIAIINFVNSYCSKKELVDDSSATLMVSFLNGRSIKEQVTSLIAFSSERTGDQQIEFLAKYVKAASISTEESAQIICEYSKQKSTETTKIVKAFAIEQDLPMQKTADLFATTLTAKNTGKKLNADIASNDLKGFIPSLDPKRARRYIIKKADEAGLTTNISTGERIGNWFRDIGDRIAGRKTPEEILFEGNNARMAISFRIADSSAAVSPEPQTPLPRISTPSLSHSTSATAAHQKRVAFATQPTRSSSASTPSPRNKSKGMGP